MNVQELLSELETFKTSLLMYQPFYAELLLNFPLKLSKEVPTAATDGRAIYINPGFFVALEPAQRRYVLMHELMHILLMHPLRGAERNAKSWNIAADIVVNRMVDDFARSLPGTMDSLALKRPPKGFFSKPNLHQSVEDLYTLVESGKIKELLGKTTRMLVDEPDLLFPTHADGTPLSEAELALAKRDIQTLLKQTLSSNKRGTDGSFALPRELMLLAGPKPINWRQLLKDYLTQAVSEDSSYATPERKYLHMDLILPGHSLSEEGELEQVWAFVDSSGSISAQDMNRFITELHRIVRDFNCELNLCYWDTQVTDEYLRLRRPDQLLSAKPRHSGGTDISCVYRYVQEKKLRPYVALILTDGYFGVPPKDFAKTLDPRKTILVLCNNSENRIYKQIGRVCRFKGDGI
ncbi:MAG: hypothetical protein II697_03215 [Clostridia bacterium]|nr:hypothetical protein [Clostridia bacterium]